MKKLLTAILIVSAALSAQAQTSSGRHSIDTDLHALRHAAVPGFNWHYDDYLQYAPAVLMLSFKTFGYESRSSWGRMLASDAFSAASMALAVNGLKYSVARLRPDGSRHNSFPSGHTATAFMTATMFHMEYGWRSPWYSIGGYTAAALTGVSRILNDRHWMSDVLAGAAIGIGSVHLGYYLSSLIFRDRGVNDGYLMPEFCYDPHQKHYTAELLFGRRLILGSEGLKEMGELPVRGSMAGISTDIPIIPGTGITARASASSMIYKTGIDASPLYSMLAGGFWNLHFAKRLEFQVKAMAGYAWMEGKGKGADLSLGTSLSFLLDSHFKLKGFLDFESMSLSSSMPWINSFIIGYTAAWYW